jgi:hypothetical protein
MSYLFYCNNVTKDECLHKKLFGNTQRFWNQVKKIKPGTPLFLYNLDTGRLHGPFQAASKHRIHLDPYAFLDSGRSYPAQVEVTWTRIGAIENAHTVLPFLSGELKCRLTPTETVKVYKALHEATSRRVASWL